FGADVRDAKLRSRLLTSTRVSVAGLAALRGELLGEPPWDLEVRLGEIGCPALVVAGARDAQVPLTLSELLARHLLASELVVFGESGGQPADEEPEGFDAAVAAFLGRVHTRQVDHA